MLTTVAPAALQPPPLSLLTCSYIPQAEVDLDGRPLGERWGAGFTWTPPPCGTIRGYNDCGPQHVVAYRNHGAAGQRYHQPVVLDAEYQCSTLGMDWDFYSGQAVAQLIACEPAAAEQELWDGTLARAATGIGGFTGSDGTHKGGYDANLWLTKFQVATDVTTVAGTPVSVRKGLELLEQFLAASGCGNAGVIHLMPQHVPQVGLYGANLTGTGRLVSGRGTTINPGVGYTGNGPATAAGGPPAAPPAGAAWAFATGRTTYRNSPIVVIPGTDVSPAEAVAQATDRSTNTVTVRAQRASAGTWDSCYVGGCLIALDA